MSLRGFGVGIGIALAPGDGRQPDDLLRRADRALYRAKAAGQSSVRFFEADMDFDIERQIKSNKNFEARLIARRSFRITSRLSR